MSEVSYPIAIGRPTNPVTLLGMSRFVHHHLLWFLIGAYAIAAVFAASFPWLTILDWSRGLDRLEQFRR